MEKTLYEVSKPLEEFTENRAEYRGLVLRRMAHCGKARKEPIYGYTLEKGKMVFLSSISGKRDCCVYINVEELERTPDWILCIGKKGHRKRCWFRNGRIERDPVTRKDYFKADCYRTEDEDALPKQIHPIHFRAEKEKSAEPIVDPIAEPLPLPEIEEDCFTEYAEVLV
jgi:hypothetical protein